MKALSMRFQQVCAGATLLAFASALPAAARDFVQDQAGMFSPATVAQLNERIGSFNAQTGKEIVVVTTPSLGGASLQSAAGAAFSQQNVNGVLIFIARDDRRDIIVPD
ncbi:MAG: TPM domain-containing protein, partial [Candidatus Cybelea sp.]